MADEPNSKPQPAAGGPAKPNISPAPTEVTVDTTPPPAAGGNPLNKVSLGDRPPAESGQIPAEPLADGTVPTVLTSSDHTTHTESKKGVMALSSVYRRADIFTTLITLGAAILAAALILGGYWYFTRSKTTTTAPPKVTTLDKADLDKLGAFFNGNSAGNNAEILNISASTFFKNRVAINNDLKVIGGAQVSGPTALADLTVDKTSTLGVTNVRGQLTVAGPVTMQSPAIINGGASINGNITASGNGSFGGSLSAGVFNARDISVSGTLNVNGHLAINGQSVSVSVDPGAGPGASAQIDGNDSAGTVTFNTGSIPNHVPNIGHQLGTITFRNPYPRVPRIIISPNGQGAGTLQYYVMKTANNFIIGTSIDAHSNTSYSFDYWVVQ